MTLFPLTHNLISSVSDALYYARSVNLNVRHNDSVLDVVVTIWDKDPYSDRFTDFQVYLAKRATLGTNGIIFPNRNAVVRDVYKSVVTSDNKIKLHCHLEYTEE